MTAIGLEEPWDLLQATIEAEGFDRAAEILERVEAFARAAAGILDEVVVTLLASNNDEVGGAPLGIAETYDDRISVGDVFVDEVISREILVNVLHAIGSHRGGAFPFDPGLRCVAVIVDEELIEPLWIGINAITCQDHRGGADGAPGAAEGVPVTRTEWNLAPLWIVLPEKGDGDFHAVEKVTTAARREFAGSIPIFPDSGGIDDAGQDTQEDEELADFGKGFHGNEKVLRKAGKQEGARSEWLIGDEEYLAGSMGLPGVFEGCVHLG